MIIALVFGSIIMAWAFISCAQPIPSASRGDQTTDMYVNGIHGKVYVHSITVDGHDYIVAETPRGVSITAKIK